MGDDDRDAILARRRQFIALALAGGATVGAAAVGAGAYAVLTPCLSPAVMTDAPLPADEAVEIADAGTDAPSPSSALDAGLRPSAAVATPPVSIPAEVPAAEAEPVVRTVPRPPGATPLACLSVAVPRPSESAETPPTRLPRVTE